MFSFIVDASVTEATVRAVEAELDRIDRLFSTYRPESQIARLNAGRIRLGDCSPDVREVLRLCADAECRTSGWFTAGYGSGIDPTGIVKGWAIGRASELLVGAGSTCHAINGGGDVLVVADPAVDEPWRVGVSIGAGKGGLVAVVAATISVLPPRAILSAVVRSGTHSQGRRRSHGRSSRWLGRKSSRRMHSLPRRWRWDGRRLRGWGACTDTRRSRLTPRERCS